MKTFNLFLGYLTVILFLSCTSDDDNTGTTPIQQENGFTYQGSFFETPHLFINDENTTDDTPSDISISLVSVDPFETSQSSDVDFVFFDFQRVNLQPETITDILDYQILQSASLLDFEITGGLTILDDTDDGFRTASSTVIINSISETEIEIEFSFEREDGEIINGNYSGEYTVFSN